MKNIALLILPVLLILFVRCQNDSLSFSKDKTLNLVIVSEENDVPHFWLNFEKHHNIEVKPRYISLDSFMLLSSTDRYNFDADAILMTDALIVQELRNRKLLQPLPDLGQDRVENAFDETNQWFLLGYNPFMLIGDSTLKSYSDLKRDKKWYAELSQEQENHFYQFAKLHFNDDKKFEVWKKEMTEVKFTPTNKDSLYNTNKGLTLYSSKHRKMQFANQEGVGMFYDIYALGVYAHPKNMGNAKKFLRWMLRKDHLPNVAERIQLIPANYANIPLYNTIKIHRITPRQLIRNVKK